MAPLVDWLYPRWVAATMVLAAMLLLYASFALRGADAAIILIYLLGPIYMLHQIEEHFGDRFRSYANTRVFGNREGLTRLTVLLANMVGVWGVSVGALYVAQSYGAAWGLAVVYGPIINALGHTGVALRYRGYNPGLGTSLLLFFPLGCYGLSIIPGDLTQHLTGIGVALALHLAIIVAVVARLRTLSAA